MKKLIVLIVYYVGFSNALIVNRTSCPEVDTVKNFSLNQVTRGIWHLYALYPNDFETYNKSVAYKGSNFRGKSHTLKLDVSETSPEYVNVQLSQHANNTRTGEVDAKIMYGIPVSILDMKLKFPLCEPNQYCIAYSCFYDDQKNVAYEYAWVAVRCKKLGPQVKAKLVEYLKTSTVLDYNKLRWLDMGEVKLQARRRSGS